MADSSDEESFEHLDKLLTQIGTVGGLYESDKENIPPDRCDKAFRELRTMTADVETKKRGILATMQEVVAEVKNLRVEVQNLRLDVRVVSHSSIMTGKAQLRADFLTALMKVPVSIFAPTPCGLRHN